MNPRRLLLFLLPLLGIVACAGRARPPAVTRAQQLTVFAAASLSDAFVELGSAFEARYPDAMVTFNFAGSQQLAQQIVQGAPGDLFASADERQMALVVGEGLTESPPRRFAGNRLTVALAPGNPAGITALEDLAHPGVEIVVADLAAPVGQYTQQFLDSAALSSAYGRSFRDGVLANIVSYEQNVRAVLTKVALGEADAGIVYASDLHRRGLPTVAIPEPLNVNAVYLVAILAESNTNGLARRFVDFVLSAEGQGILSEHGLTPPPA